MTVFDGSTTRTEYDRDPTALSPVEDPSVDTLDLLREMVDEQVNEVIPPKVLEIPGGRFRLHCSVEISACELKKWQTRGAPPHLLKTGKFNATHINQFLYHAAMIAHTLVSLDVKTKHGWVAVADKSTGEPLTLLDGLPTVLGVMDPASAVRKLFKRDSDLARACSEILVAAGWEEGGDDDEDPTD